MTPAPREHAALLSLLDAHPEIDCPGCREEGQPRRKLKPALGRLDQSDGGRDAAVYACVCGWRRTEPLRGL